MALARSSTSEEVAHEPSCMIAATRLPHALEDIAVPGSARSCAVVNDSVGSSKVNNFGKRSRTG